MLFHRGLLLEFGTLMSKINFEQVHKPFLTSIFSLQYTVIAAT